MVFSGLLSSTSSDREGSRAKATSPAPSNRSTTTTSSATRDPAAYLASEYIFDESHLRPLEPEAPDLRELNNCLEALAVIFPNVQIEVFREMLVSFDGESRLALVADALLKNRVTWVKGRWRLTAKPETPDATNHAVDAVSEPGQKPSELPPTEMFRSPEYKKAVRTLAAYEFKGLSRSTINAVLAESNYSYLEARRTLVNLSSKSWRFTISSLFLRRKPVTSTEIEHHPLVIWKSSGRGSIIPCIRPTGNAELDRELFNELIFPLKERARTALEEKDHALALTINAEEAEELESTHECACCFTTAAFEEFTTCNAEGHMICFRCVQHSITEAVFGQGWHRSIDKETGTLKCPAVESEECKGCIPSDHMHRAMLEEKKGAEILHKLDQRLAEHSLLSSGLPLIRCPFCDYAEVDDIYLPDQEAQLRIRSDSIYNLILLILCVGTVPFLLPVILFSSLVAIVISSKKTMGDYVISQVKASLARYRRRRRGLKFTCQSPRCGRTSCLSCSKEWADVHVCHESSLVALRTQVEQAMSMAVKRVCPRCNTSFVKTAGCNKLTCPCGYKMCYVCRRDISGTEGDDAGYRHFCDHFRPEGDPRPCTQCNRCNLWESEDTEAVLRQAKEEAERKWREAERRDLSGAERAFLETGVAVKRRDGNLLEGALGTGKLPSLEELCDAVVENIFV
ncbi:Ring finger protein [Pleurostoma richardsiae]|uniref:Ring finger protein n=1 Tax=Pleurostoma richardsiae TaxID=41990 RepID=A0AA38RQ55_9PEZI|nr:Ring finger protein [Pleurostoma richardsiae]